MPTSMWFHAVQPTRMSKLSCFSLALNWSNYVKSNQLSKEHNFPSTVGGFRRCRGWDISGHGGELAGGEVQKWNLRGWLRDGTSRVGVCSFPILNSTPSLSIFFRGIRCNRSFHRLWMDDPSNKALGMQTRIKASSDPGAYWGRYEFCHSRSLWRKLRCLIPKTIKLQKQLESTRSISRPPSFRTPYPASYSFCSSRKSLVSSDLIALARMEGLRDINLTYASDAEQINFAIQYSHVTKK